MGKRGGCNRETMGSHPLTSEPLQVYEVWEGLAAGVESSIDDFLCGGLVLVVLERTLVWNCRGKCGQKACGGGNGWVRTCKTCAIYNVYACVGQLEEKKPISNNCQILTLLHVIL